MSLQSELKTISSNCCLAECYFKIAYNFLKSKGIKISQKLDISIFMDSLNQAFEFGSIINDCFVKNPKLYIKQCIYILIQEDFFKNFYIDLVFVDVKKSSTDDLDFDYKIYHVINNSGQEHFRTSLLDTDKLIDYRLVKIEGLENAF